MTQPPALPPESALDEVGRALAQRQDHAGLVRLFEAWNAQGSPTIAMRLLAARAFYRLRLMDRALARLREVIEAEPGNLEAVRLQAEVYIDRGWPQRARPNLALLREAGEDVAELEARAAADPPRPEANARAIEREGDPAKMLHLAEQFLATGSFVRGRGLLERLRRVDPDHPRVAELLWGLSGESGETDRPLAELVRELAPVAPMRLPERGEEPEHTENVPVGDLGVLAEEIAAGPVDQVAFPTLFKHGFAPQAVDEELSENTMASQMVPADQLGGGAQAEATDARIDAAPAGDGGDTQILRVICPGEHASPRAHRRRDEGEDALRESLDLRRYQASMGMSAVPEASDEPAPIEPEEPEDDLLEDEDEHLVVLTRAEGPKPDEEPSRFDRPIEVVEKPIVPVRPLPPEAPEPPPSTHYPPPVPPPPAAGRSWLALGFALLAAVALAVAGLVVIRSGFSGSRAVSGARASLVEVLNRADYDALLAEEIRLEGQTGDVDARLALAEARLAIWTDFNGDPARLQSVEATAEGAVSADPHRRDFLRGGLALARHELGPASRFLSQGAPVDDGDRVLLARLHAATGDTPRALAALDGADDPDAPRIALERARVLAASGRTAEAQATVAALRARHPDHPLAQAVAALLPGADRAASLAALDTALAQLAPRRLAPRVEADLQARRAVLLAEARQAEAARAAVQAGLARDGTHPTLLFLDAAARAQAGRTVDALAALDRVAEARPGVVEAQRARVVLLLDLDRVERAEAAVKRLRAAGVAADEVEVLDALVRVVGRQQPPAAPLTEDLRQRPLGAWVDALWAAQAQRPDALDVARLAVERLASASDPFLARLRARARAHAAILEGGPAAARRALDQGGADPMVHVLLGRAYESAGDRVAASQHFDRACELGPDYAIPWYEKGRFYQDAAGGMDRAGAAWRAYLELGPEGPRAERVRALLSASPG